MNAKAAIPAGADENASCSAVGRKKEPGPAVEE
jgi:hypothetical protein